MFQNKIKVNPKVKEKKHEKKYLNALKSLEKKSLRLRNENYLNEEFFLIFLSSKIYKKKTCNKIQEKIQENKKTKFLINFFFIIFMIMK